MSLPIVKGDYHLVVNDKEERFNSEAKLFRWDGVLIWTKECLAKGQNPDYSLRNGDTPPGKYKIGSLTITQTHEPASIWNSYGKYFFDLVELTDAESRFGRAGVGIHGGGTGAPDPLAPFQMLVPTCGCIRFYNADLEKNLYPLYEQVKQGNNTIWVSVNQF